MAMPLVPAASSYDVSKQTEKLRSLYVNGTRITLGLVLPILLTLITRGHTFISLWMGPIYARESGNVLVVLAVPLIFCVWKPHGGFDCIRGRKHKKSAVWAICEGIANLTLSVTLVHWFGIYGVAFGTMIPSLYFQLLIWPRYVYELVGIRASAVVRDVWAPMFLAATPFALVSYAVNRYMPTSSIAVALQTLAILPVFIGALMLAFPEPMSHYVLPRVRSFMLSRTMDM